MVNTLQSKEKVTKDPIVLKMRKDSGYNCIGNYVKPKPGFRSEGYKEFVSSIARTPWGNKVVSSPRGGEEYVSYKSPVHKPLEMLTEEDFQGPFEQRNGPLVGIIYKKQEIYFGLINNKLATFSILYNQKGEKQMILYDVRKVSDKENNRGYLKAVAKVTLTDLMKKEIARLEDNKKRLVPVFKINLPEYNMHQFGEVA
tara:strand:- start:625 stop:1221 length:597 start_codon:yes stop_codon:yes gene_type:complete